jgi:hypothetical protein
MKKKTEQETETRREPFFARFLENQELAHAAAGKTLKYPSDNDELPFDP